MCASVKNQKEETSLQRKAGGGDEFIAAHTSIPLLPCGKFLNTHTCTNAPTGRGSSYVQILYVILSVLTCFFFCASLLSIAGLETSKVFCAAFKAAGLYTVFVRPVDVDNTYQHKFNFLKRSVIFIIPLTS